MISYKKSKIDSLKIKFDGVESIDKNYSQSYQDMFVLSMLNGKRNGTFLEIGAFDPTHISNTYLLEDKFGWKGISIDIEPSCKSSFESKRKSRFVLADALKIDYNDLLSGMPDRIDYLQLDIEPTINTFNCLKLLPLDKYRFSVITYETDYYDTQTPQNIKDMVRSESRRILTSYGYKLVVGDVESDRGCPYEDWYVDTSIVAPEIYQQMSGDTIPDIFMRTDT